MKYKTTLMIVLMVLVPSLVYAEHIKPFEDQPCLFTSNIDRTVRQYSERVQIFGFVHPNCETYEKWDEYQVNIKIVNNATGEIVKDEWIPKARVSIADDKTPKLYEWKAIIQETGVRLADDKQNRILHHIYPNQYYTETPLQLNKVHFDPFVVYSVVASYGNMTVFNNFIIIE